ncbi:MAG: glycine cleavage T C-terminal barrel domain-containing protein [Pyrinomonadaceae bacterium]
MRFKVPSALGILQKLTDVSLSPIKYYHFSDGQVCGAPAMVSRTGYTGEDGFEIYAAPEKAELIWDRILDAGNYGQPDGVNPCGLASRNTLRLEASMSLYGHEIDETTTLLEANLGWICKFNKGDFIGRRALLEQKEKGVDRRLIGFEMIERGIARDGQDVSVDGERAGRVASGSPAPFLKKNIGLAYMPTAYTQIGQRIEIDVRARSVAARIVSTPFYKRERAATT